MVWKDHGNLGHKAWLKPEAVTPLRAWWFHQWARWVHVISPQVPSSTCKFLYFDDPHLIFYRCSTDTGNWLDHGLTKRSQLCSTYSNIQLHQISKKKKLCGFYLIPQLEDGFLPSVSSLHQSPPDGKMDFTAAQVAPAEAGWVVYPVDRFHKTWFCENDLSHVLFDDGWNVRFG